MEDIAVTKTIEAPKEELTTGSTFASRYQIIEELGRGGMGRVYKALDKEVNEKIALKLIKPEIARDKKTIERFRNELKFARKIRHKYVCQMYDLSIEEGGYYITMEYVRGDDLKGLIRRMGRFSAAQAINITRQVCEGLVEAHKLGVVHRDLKPQNIMIDQNGNARIMDFGIARSLKGKGLTGAGVMIGTPEYMSPEQVEGKEVDQRSDIYSLGVILYKMMTGQTPFQGDTPFTIGVKHKSEIPQNPKKLNDQISDDLSQVILRCLEKEKKKRYQSAGELRNDLQNIEKGLPTAEKIAPSKRPLTSREFTVKFSLKKLLIPALIVAFVIIAAVALLKILPQKKAAPQPLSDKPSIAVMYFKNNTGDEGLDHWRAMLSNLLIADLTQSKYIRILSEDKLFDILTQLNQTEARAYSAEVLNQVATQGRVNHILQGAYAKAGDEFRINVILQNASTLEHISSESISGKGEQSIFSLIDELTKRIKTHFALSPEQIAGDIDKDVGIATTSSPKAYRYYVEGTIHDGKGEYRKVIESMQKAVEIDPEFASAYLAMSWSYGNLAYFAEERKYKQKALELSYRLSDREKYLIQGAFHLDSEKTYDKALKAFKKLISLYPDDISGNNYLGNLYTDLGETDKAVEYYGASIKNGTEDVAIYTNQAGRYRDLGLYDKAVEVCENYIKNIGDRAAIRRNLAMIYREQGNYERALLEAEKTISLSGDYWMNIRRKGDVYLYMGDWEKAEQEYRKLFEKEEQVAYAWGLLRLQSLYMLKGKFRDCKEKFKEVLELSERLGQPVWTSRFHYRLAYVELRSGDPGQALEELNEAWRIAVEEEDFSFQRDILCDMGLVYLEMNSIGEAQRTADRLKQIIEQAPNKKLIRDYYYLMGMIELQKKNYAKAVEFIKKALPLLPADSGLNLVYTSSLGLAFYKVGDLENAAKEYERTAALNTGRLTYGDIYVKSFYMLGRIYQDMEWEGKARENYEKFLELWKAADSSQSEVKDARTRLQQLHSRK
jgi:serine/threonine protein kinase/predicted Zn-dependent protease